MDRIRSTLILTIAALPVLAMSATGAAATEWCGSTSHGDTAIECGYSSAANCENATGKGGVCFVDPDIVLNSASATHGRSAPRTKIPRQS